MKKFFKIISIMLCLGLLLSFPIDSSAADSSFEKSLSGFPESYKVYLRALHKDHPNWEFVPLKTGLNWNTAVDNECLYGRSLVSNWSVYTDLFKSKASGDYDYSTGRYIEKDGGFVTANKMAVSFFMDPRNSLNEENIFQFEDLSFDESFNVKAIGVILADAYCPPEYKKDPTEYYKVIYNAGKTYNVNPCYLAAKIKNEIGTGSSSVYGTSSSYPGIYNFYNIGASDGAGAITRGLAWAASGSSYHRPWTTAKKSIVGGAEFIAENYISEGQYTGYLQKFNVNPNSSYGLYNHQYMTNICGSMSQGYSTYLSYLSIGIIDNYFKFSIPVFSNMPGHDDDTGTIYPSDASSQKGKISVSYCNVRKGPSTNNEAYSFQLTSGTSVTILDCVKTDSLYYDSILRYPFWYHIKFTVDSKTYKGYVPAGFVSITSSVDVNKGSYKPKFKSTNDELSMNLVSYDTRYATISDDTTIKFIAKGSAEIGFYDSVGKFRMVKYKITNNAVSTPEPADEPPAKVSGLSASDITPNSFTLTWKPVSGADGYRVYLYNESTDSYDNYLTTPNTICDFSALDANKTYKVKVKAYTKSSSGENLWGDASSVYSVDTASAKVSGLSASNITQTSFTLNWKAVSGADGYKVYLYNNKTSSYDVYTTTSKTSCNFTSLTQATNYKVKVKSYSKVNGETIYGTASSAYTVSTLAKDPDAPEGLTQSESSTDYVTLKWSEVKNADGYDVYMYDKISGEYKLVSSSTEPTCSVFGLSPLQTYKFKVKTYIVVNGKKYSSVFSAEVSASTGPKIVTGLSQDSTSTSSFTLKWNPVSGAEGYSIYSIDMNNYDYEFIGKVYDSTELEFDSLDSGELCAFSVVAFAKINGKTCNSNYSDVFLATTLPGKVKSVKQASTTSNGYTLKWGKQNNASGYCIYKRNSKGVYKKIDSITDNQYEVTSLKPLSSDKYKIRAFIKCNGKVYWGDYSNDFTAYTSPEKVTGLKKTDIKGGGYKLSWTKQSSVSGYKIYTYNKSTGKYTALISTKSNYINISSNESKIYAVRSYKTINGTNYFSDYSNHLTVK